MGFKSRRDCRSIPNAVRVLKSLKYTDTALSNGFDQNYV